MKKFRMLTILILTLGVLVFNVKPALAFPPLPSGFYGTVKIGGVNVADGTVVSAKINGVTYATATVMIYQGDTVYSLDVPGDDTDAPGTIEGGVPGDTVVFFIGDMQATQTAPWQTGTNVSLNLTGNNAPTITEGDSVTIGMTTAFNLTLHASDVDGDTLTWSIKTQANHGTASSSGTGTSKVIYYTPSGGYFGSDSFVVQVSDGKGGTDTITVNVTINAVNTSPVITEGASVSVTMSVNGGYIPFNLTLNATDVDGNTLTWSISTPAGHGTASTSGTGLSKAISYTPAHNYVGADSFAVQVSDGNGGTDTITVHVNINAYVFLPVIKK
jgi:hypothetical protein